MSQMKSEESYGEYLQRTSVQDAIAWEQHKLIKGLLAVGFFVLWALFVLIAGLAARVWGVM